MTPERRLGGAATAGGSTAWRLDRRPALGPALAAAAAVVLVAAVVHAGSLLLVRHRGALTGAERLKAENEARTSLIQIIGGVALVGGFTFSVRTFALTRQTQRTDRFTKALDQIGNKDSEAVRVGGIYSLWLLAEEADYFWPLTEEVLAALVRAAALPGSPLRSDVQAALTVIGRRPAREPGFRGTPVDLREVDLSKADLTGANLERVRFDGACLEHAKLVDARLVRARLVGAKLAHADLKSADLTNASLVRATLRRAEMYGAILDGADLTDCDLAGATNLTADQLASARGRPAVAPE